MKYSPTPRWGIRKEVHVKMTDPIVKTEVLARLKNIRGHIAGIERMLEEDQSCSNLLVQIAAVRSSIDKVGFFLLENNAVNCLCEDTPALAADRQKVEQIIKQLLSFVKK
jgi:DNA-binding FrmR family transcriptional regulator